MPGGNVQRVRLTLPSWEYGEVTKIGAYHDRDRGVADLGLDD